MEVEPERMTAILQIIERRERLSNEGNAEMPYSEYMEIKKLLTDKSK